MLSPFATNDSLFRLIHAAQRAPSVHNTQPWSFHIVGDDRIDLRANRARQLRIADPRGREMIISCGAALFNLRMALRVAGHDPVVWLVPDQENDPDLLASVEIVTNMARPPTSSEQRLYEAIAQRHTNRAPFSARLVPMSLVTELEHAAWRERANVWLLHRHEVRQILHAARQASKALGADAAYVRELQQWIGDGDGDSDSDSHSDSHSDSDSDSDSHGVPAAAVPQPRRAPAGDLGLGLAGKRRRDRFGSHPRLMVLSTETDTPSDWLRAGQALERVLLTATRYGVAASFLTQPFELQDRYATPNHRLVTWLKHPQMVLRLGYGPPVAGTPREDRPDVVDCRVQPPLPVRPRHTGGEPDPAS